MTSSVKTNSVFRTGNSLAVTVPASFVQALGVKPGDKVLVKEEIERASVSYRFSGTQQMTLSQSFFKKSRKTP